MSRKTNAGVEAADQWNKKSNTDTPVQGNNDDAGLICRRKEQNRYIGYVLDTD